MPYVEDLGFELNRREIIPVNRNPLPYGESSAQAPFMSNLTVPTGFISVNALDGVLNQQNLNIANRGWHQTCTFSITDATTVAWGAGSLTSADGTTYIIGASNTGTMSALTYIYLDILKDPTAYQVATTATDAFGVGKVLVAIAQNGATLATYRVIEGVMITGDNITANSILANKMNVTQLSAISADMGTITAGTITVDDEGYIRGGQTDFFTGVGWFLGYSGGAYKLSLGNPAGDYLTWNGSTLVLAGSLSLNSPMQLKSYTVATLPVPLSSTALTSPTAFD